MDAQLERSAREREAAGAAERENERQAEKRALEEQLQRTVREKRDSAEEAAALRGQLQAVGAEAAAADARKAAEVRALRATVEGAVADRAAVEERCAGLRGDLAAVTVLVGQREGDVAAVRGQLGEVERQRRAAEMGCDFATEALRGAQQELDELVRTSRQRVSYVSVICQLYAC